MCLRRQDELFDGHKGQLKHLFDPKAPQLRYIYSKSSKFLANYHHLGLWVCHSTLLHDCVPIRTNHSRPHPWLRPIRIQRVGNLLVYNGLDREIRILHNIIHFVAFKKPYDSKKLKEYKQKNNFYHLYTILGFNNPWYSETHLYDMFILMPITIYLGQ